MSQSKSSFPIPTLQSAYAYTPKFELWMNGIVWQAIYNVVNSYNLVEVESAQAPAIGGRMKTHAPEDMFIGRVRILEDTVLAIQEPDSIYKEQFDKAKETHGETGEYEMAHAIYRAILGLLQRNGHVRFKPPRDFADD